MTVIQTRAAVITAVWVDKQTFVMDETGDTEILTRASLKCVTHTLWSGVDCHGAADQADVQAAFLVDQAGDGGFVRGEEVLQANLLGPLAAFIHDDATKGTRDKVSFSIMWTSLCIH